ncbi:sigma-70 family RNA polymerase sigma factor [Nannocystis radixulma]|uniref:Sigma-70 family RNA polymerase sigma factor n=1 Tax=Nannocystis radixulma TaxID=2995305 RepID=A0ABT5B6T9_9BACT|nr:sigma-70 family RNA polymerase sigma factor [Nannocystis radixulma]MDC0668736.1 sigma-70 family RNA polymerase sigma factor [Nannocystis radixulma]
MSRLGPSSPSGPSGPRTERSDVELLAAMASGDSEALGDLHDRYVGLLLATAIRILGNRREAEDLVHDVLMEVWQKCADYDPERGSVRTWLLVRLRSRALDRCRRAGRFRVETLEERNLDDLGPAGGDEPGQSLDHARVRRALHELPPAQRQVLELAYFDGLSASEIAERLAVPIGTVKSRTAAGLAKLRAALHAEEKGDR